MIFNTFKISVKIQKMEDKNLAYSNEDILLSEDLSRSEAKLKEQFSNKDM